MTSAAADQPAFFTGPEHAPFVFSGGETGALLIHGFPGTPAEMRPLGERLGAAGIAAHGLLLPGFGPEIARLGEMRRDDWLSAAAAEWASVRAAHARAILIGYSMGGALALQLAAASPPVALILLSPFWQLGGWQAQLLPVLKYIFPSIAPFQKADFTDPAVRQQVAAIAPGINLDDPETRQFFREQVRLPLGVLDEVRRLGREAFRAACEVIAPTLILQAAGDGTVAAQETRALAAEMPAATYREVPGNHDFVRLGPGAYDYTPDVLAFLSRVE